MADTFRAALKELHDAICEQFFGNDIGLPPRLIKAANEAGRLLCRTVQPGAEPEPERLTDQEIQEWADATPEAPLEEPDPWDHGWRRCFTSEEFGNTIRAALIHWGRPAPEPPADGEVAELVEDLREQANHGYCEFISGDDLRRAADLLERLSPPHPGEGER